MEPGIWFVFSIIIILENVSVCIWSVRFWIGLEKGSLETSQGEPPCEGGGHTIKMIYGRLSFPTNSARPATKMPMFKPGPFEHPC